MKELGLFFLTEGCVVGDADISAFMSVFRLVITIIQYAVPVALILWRFSIRR